MEFAYHQPDPCPDCPPHVIHWHCPGCAHPAAVRFQQSDADEQVTLHCLACGCPVVLDNPWKAQLQDSRDALKRTFNNSPDILDEQIEPN